MTTKRVSVTAAAALAAVGLIVGAPTARAQNVSLGAVTLSPSSGAVDGTPSFETGTTTAPCPPGYGDNVQLRLGPPGGPYSNIARPAGGGGFDAAPVSLHPDRSFATALGAPPTDGEWWVVVECHSLTQGRHPDRFVTAITVAGGSWQVGAGRAAAPTAGDGANGTSADQELLLTIPPGDSTPTPTPSGGPTETPGDDDDDDGGLASTGFPGLLAAVAGLVLIGVGASVVRRFRRRRDDLAAAREV